MGNKVYIVDYDIPEKPARKKVQFYRDLKNVKEHTRIEYSTLSVFRTNERMIAEAVYHLVMYYGGCAHVYYGEEITYTLIG
ncbi:MAG: hypothetical protein PVF58_03925 [Candidatus Methanofastidiosia archaeon]|jgi:hypothetical protein